MAKSIISIVVPVYNAEKYLERCLDSIINQSYKDIQIICVNDGSSDSSLQILTQYALFDSRIKLINQENKGVSEARNTAFNYITGEYVMFVDSDDYIEHNACETAINAAKRYNADLVFWSYVREFNTHSKEKHFFWEDRAVFDETDVKFQLHRRLCGLLGEELYHPDYLHSFEPLWNKLYRASYILDNNIRFIDINNIATSEDGIFNLYALEHVKKAIYIKKCLYHYVKTNNNSLTSNYKDKLFSQWQNLFDIIQKYIDQKDLSQDYRDALDNRIALSIIGLGLNIVHSTFNTSTKVKLISKILSSKRYRKAYKKLEYKYFPFHWKIFFLFAKFEFSYGVYLLLKLICYLKNH